LYKQISEKISTCFDLLEANFKVLLKEVDT